MSNFESTIEYGTRQHQQRKVELFVNVPYLLNSIGTDYERLTRIKAAQNLRLQSNPQDLPQENEVSEMERYLNDLERKATLVKGYLDTYQIDATKYQRCVYYGFFTEDLENFKIAYRAMIDDDRKQLRG